MRKIDIESYKLYCKYRGQAEWEEDSRLRMPRDVYDKIGEDFHIIETISNNLFMINSGRYSDKLMKEMQKEINQLRTRVTENTYGYIERREHIYPTSKKNFFQRVFNW